MYLKKDALSYKDSILRDRDEQLNKLKQEVDSSTDKEQLAAVQLLHREAELAAVTEQLQKEMSRDINDFFVASFKKKYSQQYKKLKIYFVIIDV